MNQYQELVTPVIVLQGLPELRAALQKKIEAENGLRGVSTHFVMSAHVACKAYMSS